MSVWRPFVIYRQKDGSHRCYRFRAVTGGTSDEATKRAARAYAQTMCGKLTRIMRAAYSPERIVASGAYRDKL